MVLLYDFLPKGRRLVLLSFIQEFKRPCICLIWSSLKTVMRCFPWEKRTGTTLNVPAAVLEHQPDHRCKNSSNHASSSYWLLCKQCFLSSGQKDTRFWTMPGRALRVQADMWRPLTNTSESHASRFPLSFQYVWMQFDGVNEKQKK